MPMDAYTLCPGGTGKKIKFCCPDLLGDHQKVERMCEGGQFQAALSYLDRLEEKHPGRACLMMYRCQLLSRLDRFAEAEAAAVKFRELHPTNPIALVETAFAVALNQGGRAGLPWLERALEATGSKITNRVLQMLSVVGQLLANVGEFMAAVAVFRLGMILTNSRDFLDGFRQILGLRSLPVWYKEDGLLAEGPTDAPWSSDFREAKEMAYRGQWSAAEQRFVAIAAEFGDQPAVWANIATVRGWLADREGCIEALRKYSRLDVPLEDAVEAEAKAMFLDEDPLGDVDDVVSLTYPIVDVEQFQVAIDSSKRFHRIPVDPEERADEDTPPPLARHIFLDRDRPADDASTDPANWPRLLCQAEYYGKETDREARLRLFPIAAAEEQTIERLVRQVLFGVLGPLVERRVMTRASRTRELIPIRSLPLPHVKGDAYRGIMDSVCESHLFHQWPDLPLGVLDGKTPQVAARDPKYRVPLLAAILMVEFWTQQEGYDFDFNPLRARLGLPTLDPIDPQQVDITHLPVGRLGRVIEQGLPRAKLEEQFQRAAAFNFLPGIRKFGRALVDHPESQDARKRTEILAFMAWADVDPRRSLACIEEGRKIAESVGESSAQWDLIEVQLHIKWGNSEAVDRLLNHLLNEHGREPGVAAAVYRLLVAIGAITPDGLPVAPRRPPEQAEPKLAVPSAGGAGPGELWTPDGQSASDDKPKLWVPGMD